MTNEKLVSVIIPAFNCGSYIENCITSISNQTYKNIEILIIDDGSTDDTPDILDNLAKKDSRIRVFHKTNGGVSSARNYGLKNATGVYVTFVDGDDFLDTDFLEYMIDLSIKTDASFCVSTKCISRKKHKNYQESIKILDNKQSVSLLLSFELYVGCWNKLYKKSFLDEHDISFNENLFYGEGLNFITTCASKSNSVTTTNVAKYFYRKNNISSATSIFNIEKYINGEQSLRIIKDTNLIDKNNLRWWCIHSCFFYLSGVVSVLSSNSKKKYSNFYHEFRQKFKSMAKNIFFYRELTFYRRMIVLLGLISPKILSFLDKRRRRKIEKESV